MSVVSHSFAKHGSIFPSEVILTKDSNINFVTSCTCLFFVIIGWILIFLLNYYLINLHGEETLTDSNIFEVKSIKEIEIFISNFLNIMTHINHHSQLLLAGLINSIIDL